MSKTQRIEATMEVVRTLVALLIAYGLALIILFAISDDPVYIVQQFILGPLSSPRRIGSIINLAIPFTICGLAMCFMYAVNRFNLVPEGIFMLSACTVTYVALQLGSIPGALLIPVLRNRWATVSLILWAVLNCWSRMYLGVHYPGDILAGTAVGIAAGLLVLCATRRYSPVSTARNNGGHAAVPVALAATIAVIAVISACG